MWEKTVLTILHNMLVATADADQGVGGVVARRGDDLVGRSTRGLVRAFVASKQDRLGP